MKPAPLLLFAAALLLGGMTACGDDGTPTGPDSEAGTLTGAVAFVKTGDGVPNLLVALLQGGAVVRTAHTGADGSFSFGDVPAGRYTARLTGFDVAGLNMRATAFDPTASEVTLGGDPVDIAFAAVGLVPPRVAGDVTCAGVAVEGARLRVIGGEGTDEIVRTDVRGRYGATGLSVGSYAVIPLEAPCVLTPSLGAVKVIQGQSGEVDFSG